MQPKQTMELHKHKAHAPLLLAEKLSRGQSAINKGQRIETYCMIVSVVKYREIFQVYNVKYGPNSRGT